MPGPLAPPRPHIKSITDTLIEFPQDLLIRRVDEATARPVPAGQSKLSTFEDLDEAMLVLGEPGAGKTVWLNQLAVEVTERALTDPDQPIPVVVNLASWAAHRGSLDDWLVDELDATYKIDRALGDRLVQADALLPLLDGLDEVPERDRAGCVAAINAYQQARADADPDRRLRPLVVCSRRAEVETLAANPDQMARLRLAGSVTLQPPSRAKVVDYLTTVGAVEVLAMLPARPDDDPELWVLLHSPLTLSVVALAQARAVAALHQPADRRLDALLDAYVEVLLTPRDRGGRLRAQLASWPPERTRGWLAWLAASMNRRNLVEFRLPQLDPTWLASRWARWCGLWLPGLVVGLVFGIVVAIGNGWRAGGVVGLLFGVGLRISHQNWSAKVLRWPMRAAWLAFALGIGLALGLAAGLLVALVGVVFVVLDSVLFPQASRGAIYDEGLRRSGPHVGLLAGGLVLASQLTDQLNGWLPAGQLTQGLFGPVFVGRLIHEPFDLVATGLQAGLTLGLLERWDGRWALALREWVEGSQHPGPPQATYGHGLGRSAGWLAVILVGARILGGLLYGAVLVVTRVSHSWPWTSCAGRGATANRRRRIGGLSVDKGTADAEPACPARFWQRPAFGKANKLSVTI